MDRNQFVDVNNYHYTDKQLKQIAAVQQILEERLPSIATNLSEELTKLYSDADASLRFLNAREFNEAKTLEMWEKWVRWHQSYRPDLIKDTEPAIQRQLATGKLVWHKFDKERRPCLYYRMRYHVPNLVSVDEAVRYFLFMLEQGIQEGIRLGSEGTVCVIYDRRGYTKSKYDDNAMKTMKVLTPILQDYYPERLSRFYVLGANWFYRAAFKVVSTFMSKKTTEKVRVLAADTDLLNFFAPINLIKEYGGDSDLLQATGQSQQSSKTTSSAGYCTQLAGDQSMLGFDAQSHQPDEVEDEEEDEATLKEMQKRMFKDAGVKL